MRFAAPSNGTNRFAPPQPPLNQTTPAAVIIDASTNGALCLCQGCTETQPSSNPAFFTRDRVAEDCLFLGIFAPSAATPASKLPIMLFIGGGGFTSQANGNFNGSNLVAASGHAMLVVRVNYRVGILGFASGRDIAARRSNSAPNNGFRDMIAAARFVQQHAAAFGGDPGHIVVAGDSSGAEAIVNLLAMNGGKGFPGLFVGAAVESVGSYPTGFPERQEGTWRKYLNATGCAGAADALQCMRDVPIDRFQNLTKAGGWGPVIDDELIVSAPRRVGSRSGLRRVWRARFADWLW